MIRSLQFSIFFALALASQTAGAFVATLASGTRSVYLRVGDGKYTGRADSGGTPGNLATINVVSVSVPAAQVGNGTSQAMTSSATQAQSFYDNYAFCNLPDEVYVGGFFRRVLNNGSSSATLTVTSPAVMTNAGGDTLPISEISWTSSGNGDTGAQPIPAGTFTGGTQTLASFPVNTWRESCHSFSYANSDVVASGTYTARVTYTLSVP